MENDIIESLDDVGYSGPMLEEGALEKALEDGPKSVDYTRLVEWLSRELKTFCSLEEHVNAVSSADDANLFLLEVSSFLKELGCVYSALVEGNISERLSSKENRILLLNFLLSELEAAKMIHINKPDLSRVMEVKLDESATANDLKSMLIALKFPKPPANIAPGQLFGKIEQKMKEVLVKASPELVEKPLFIGVLSDKQWQSLSELHDELQEEYQVRRSMLLKRLEVTIKSFQWSDRIKNQEDQIAAIYMEKRKDLSVTPDVKISDMLAARESLSVLEKTSSASVRKNTQTSINKIIIGSVPDRGGRPSEQQPPPPEMPNWQQQRPGGVGFRENRGGKVQGGLNQGSGGYQDRGGSGGIGTVSQVRGSGGGYQNSGGASVNQGRVGRGGSVEGFHNRGNVGYYQNRGSAVGVYLSGNATGYQDRSVTGGGYQDVRNTTVNFPDRGGCATRFRGNPERGILVRYMSGGGTGCYQNVGVPIPGYSDRGGVNYRGGGAIVSGHQAIGGFISGNQFIRGVVAGHQELGGVVPGHQGLAGVTGSYQGAGVFSSYQGITGVPGSYQSMGGAIPDNIAIVSGYPEMGAVTGYPCGRGNYQTRGSPNYENRGGGYNVGLPDSNQYRGGYQDRGYNRGRGGHGGRGRDAYY